LRQYIYSSGNTLPPMDAYRAFRGRAPSVVPMLKKKGLVDA
jgi:peptidyl-dipeptidase Dcp